MTPMAETDRCSESLRINNGVPVIRFSISLLSMMENSYHPQCNKYQPPVEWLPFSGQVGPKRMPKRMKSRVGDHRRLMQVFPILRHTIPTMVDTTTTTTLHFPFVMSVITSHDQVMLPFSTMMMRLWAINEDLRISGCSLPPPTSVVVEARVARVPP